MPILSRRTHARGCGRGPAEPVLGGRLVRAVEAPHNAVLLAEVVDADGPHLEGGRVGGIVAGRR